MLIELIYGIDITKLAGNHFFVLIGFILFDVLTGILRAGKDRKINSSINFEGLVRKTGEMLGIVFLTFVDIYLNTDGLITKIGINLLIVMEVISIIENFKQIGIDFDFLMKYFDEDKYSEDGEKVK